MNMLCMYRCNPCEKLSIGLCIFDAGVTLVHVLYLGYMDLVNMGTAERQCGQCQKICGASPASGVKGISHYIFCAIF